MTISELEYGEGIRCFEKLDNKENILDFKDKEVSLFCAADKYITPIKYLPKQNNNHCLTMIYILKYVKRTIYSKKPIIFNIRKYCDTYGFNGRGYPYPKSSEKINCLLMIKIKKRNILYIGSGKRLSYCNPESYMDVVITTLINPIESLTKYNWKKNNRIIAIGCFLEIKFFDVEVNRILYGFKLDIGITYPICLIEFRMSNGYIALACGCDNGDIFIWPITPNINSKQLRHANNSLRYLGYMLFDPDLKLIRILEEFAHEKSVCCLIWKGGEKNQIISGGTDGYIKVWNINYERENLLEVGNKFSIAKSQKIDNNREVYSLIYIYLNKNPHLISGDIEGKIKIWNLDKEVCLHEYQLKEGIWSIMNLNLRKNILVLAVGSENGTASILKIYPK